MHRVVLVSLLCLMASIAAAQEETPHDILFIAIDDLNDWVGHLGGHPQTQTPNIDRLAARGLAFTNAQAPSAVCHASRTAILMGLKPSTSGIYGNGPDWRGLPVFEDKQSLPHFFRSNGYTTKGAGKIFHAHTYLESGLTGFNDPQGWDAFYPSLQRQLPDEFGPYSIPANGGRWGRSFDWAGLVAEDDAMGATEPVLVLQGSFEGADDFHQGSGMAAIYQLADGSHVLRFDDFRVTNGPDLHVLLTTSPDGQMGDDYVDLGSLKGNIGSQNYEIPGDVDVSRYQSVIIYCVPFHVLFASAVLQ